MIARKRDNDHRTRWVLLGILVLSLALNSIGIGYGLPYPAPPQPSSGLSMSPLWVYDRVGGLRPLAYAREKFSWGELSRNATTYPLAHYMVLSAAYAPYLAYVYLSDGMVGAPSSVYPHGFADPTAALSGIMLIGRLVSAVMGTGIVFVVYLIGQELFGRTAGLLAALLVALNNLLIFYAHNTTLNVPYNFWAILGIYAYVCLVKYGRSKWYLWMGIFAGIAMATKDQAYGLFLWLPVPILWAHFGHHARRPIDLKEAVRVLFHKNIWLAALGFGGAYAVFNNLLFNWPRAVLHFEAALGFTSLDRYLDPSSAADHVQLLRLTVRYLIDSMGLPLFVVCMVGLGYCVWKAPKWSGILLVPLFSYYVMVVVFSLFYVHARHVISPVLLLAAFGGKLCADWLTARRPPAWIRYAVLILVFGFSLVYGLSADLTILNDSRQVAGQWMEQHVPAGASVEVYDLYLWLPWYLDRYDVYRSEIEEDYAMQLSRRKPEYVVMTEHRYRHNADFDEAELYRRALQEDEALKGLYSGELGYRLAFEFKYKLHDWFYPDMVLGQNPRIMIFQRVS